MDKRTKSIDSQGDLVIDFKGSHVATFIDKELDYTMLLKLRGKDVFSVNDARIKKFKEIS